MCSFPEPAFSLRPLTPVELYLRKNIKQEVHQIYNRFPAAFYEIVSPFSSSAVTLLT